MEFVSKVDGRAAADQRNTRSGVRLKHLYRGNPHRHSGSAQHRAFYLDDKIGSTTVGNEADWPVLDLAATPVLEYRLRSAEELGEALFVLMTWGDDRAACATYVSGNLRTHEMRRVAKSASAHRWRAEAYG